jgi:hypothetical protein
MDPHERSIIERAADRLADRGVTVQLLDAAPRVGGDAGVDAVAELSRRGSVQRYAVQVRRSPRPARMTAPDFDGLPLLVLAEHLAGSTADALARAGFQYADASGNAHLEFGEVLIDVRGLPRAINEEAGESRAPVRRAGNLFSTRRAQVLCVLFAWPALWQGGTREIARAAGVSVGQAHETLTMLREAGYDDERLAVGPLIDLWAAAFPAGLGSRLHLGSVSGDVERPVRAADSPVYVGGEVAARALVRPLTLTVYADELTPRLMVANRWRTDGLPNVTVRRRFWTSPQPESLEEVGEAPWPLVYADLYNAEDPRVRAAAEEWRQTHA